MTNAFHIGQKVVRVRTGEPPDPSLARLPDGAPRPRIGCVYTVSKVLRYSRITGLVLVEFPQYPQGFNSRRFRPLLPSELEEQLTHIEDHPELEVEPVHQ